MNKVILLGRLTRDPESRMTQNNLEVTRFSLACNSDIVSRTSENNAEFINCVAFGNIAGTIAKYCIKGTSISVIGRLHNSSYTGQDGNKRYSTDVTVESFEFAGSSNRSQNSSNNYIQGSNFQNETSNVSFQNQGSAFNNSSTQMVDSSYDNIGEDITLSSDDLPF